MCTKARPPANKAAKHTRSSSASSSAQAAPPEEVEVDGEATVGAVLTQDAVDAFLSGVMIDDPEDSF